VPQASHTISMRQEGGGAEARARTLAALAAARDGRLGLDESSEDLGRSSSEAGPSTAMVGEADGAPGGEGLEAELGRSVARLLTAVAPPAPLRARLPAGARAGGRGRDAMETQSMRAQGPPPAADFPDAVEALRRAGGTASLGPGTMKARAPARASCKRAPLAPPARAADAPSWSVVGAGERGCGARG